MTGAASGAVLSPEGARRVFLTLTATRWLPVGLVVGLMTLWQLDRGLSLAQATTMASISGLVVLALELPTAGLADALGRRPVLVVAAVVNVLAGTAYLLAHSWGTFAVAAALMGLFRALDSGPLEAWYVDTVHATRPGADVDQDLSRSTSLLGLSLAGGALVSGGLVAWHPVVGRSPLWLPVLVSLVLAVGHLVAVLVLLREPSRPGEADAGAVTGWRRARDSAAATPSVIASGLSLLRSSRVLRGLVLLEVCWSVALCVSEVFFPVRLSELLGGEARAGALVGPVAAVAWGVFAVGARATGWLSARVGVVRAAIVARVLHSVGAMVMALAMGPLALVVLHLLTYTAHGMQGPVYNALLHREASARNRATVLSMASMCAFGSTALALPLLGQVAERVSTPVAMASAGAVGLLGVLCLLPALRAEDDRAKTPTAAPGVPA